LAENPGYAPTAWNEMGYAEWLNLNPTGALAAANRSIALKPFWGNLLLKASVELYSFVDLDAAKASLEQIPAVILQDDMGVALACELYYFRRDPAAMLQHAQAASKPWLHSNGFDGPLGLWTGLAHAMAGEAEAARLEWSTALDLVNSKLSGDPSSGALLEWKGTLQALLGDSKTSLGTFQLAEEMHPQARLRPYLDIRIHAMALDGETQEAGEQLARSVPPHSYSPRYLQLDPWFDPLRNTPRFKALMDRLEGEDAAAKTNTSASHPPRPNPAGYSTIFPLSESPISEGGLWMGGKVIGLDWGDVSTTPGFAFGRAGPKDYADSVALLAGEWPSDQRVEVVVRKGAVFRYPEVSMRLRSSLAKHNCTGYEISYSLKDGDAAYLIIVRWNGPLADFTYLLNVRGKPYAVNTGDVVMATVAGNEIKTYKNGLLMGAAKDGTYTRGNPGFGFNEGSNGDYGISRFSATATDSPTF
jgi:hypothetical protein